MNIDQSPDPQEQTRLLFATAILASFLGYLAYRQTFIQWAGRTPEKILLITFAVSTVCCVLYLLMTAASLKHHHRNSLLLLVTFTDNDRKLIYDISVDTFLLVPLLFALSRTPPVANSSPSLASVIIGYLQLIALAVGIRYGWKALLWFLRNVFTGGPDRSFDIFLTALGIGTLLTGAWTIISPHHYILIKTLITLIIVAVAFRWLLWDDIRLLWRDFKSRKTMPPKSKSNRPQ